MTPRFLADENVDSDLVLGLKRRMDGIDIVRVQEVGLRTLDDPTVLRWEADAGRILISRDIKTIPTFAHERVIAGLTGVTPPDSTGHHLLIRFNHRQREIVRYAP